jgi:hypothetical protein
MFLSGELDELLHQRNQDRRRIFLLGGMVRSRIPSASIAGFLLDLRFVALLESRNSIHRFDPEADEADRRTPTDSFEYLGCPERAEAAVELDELDSLIRQLDRNPRPLGGLRYEYDRLPHATVVTHDAVSPRIRAVFDQDQSFEKNR